MRIFRTIGLVLILIGLGLLLCNIDDFTAKVRGKKRFPIDVAVVTPLQAYLNSIDGLQILFFCKDHCAPCDARERDTVPWMRENGWTVVTLKNEHDIAERVRALDAYAIGGLIPLAPYIVEDDIHRALTHSAIFTGLALLGTIAGGLAAALKDEHHRDAAILRRNAAPTVQSHKVAIGHRPLDFIMQARVGGEGGRAHQRTQGGEADAAGGALDEGATGQGHLRGLVESEELTVVAVHSRVTVSSRLRRMLAVVVQAASWLRSRSVAAGLTP